jgi:hypothetical protein
MPGRQENNMKYFRRLRTLLQIGSDIVALLSYRVLTFYALQQPGKAK